MPGPVFDRISDIVNLQPVLNPTLVSMRGFIGTNVSNGTDTGQTSRQRYVFPNAVCGIILCYANFFAAESSGANNIDVKASIEDPTTTSGSSSGASLIPVFFNGRRTATIEPGGVVYSDPIMFDMPAGWNIYVRSFVDVTNYGAGATFPLGLVTTGGVVNAFGQGGSDGREVNADRTDSGTISATSAACFGPATILGYPKSPGSVGVGIVGDSITSGSGEINYNNLGFAVRGVFAMNLPYVNVARSGDKAGLWTATGSWRRLQVLNKGISHALIMIGTNDIVSDGTDLATTQARLQTVYNHFDRMGKKVIACTIPPRVGLPTTRFINVTDQNPFSSESVRTGINDWLRTKPSPLYGVIDLCTAVEVNTSNVLTLNGGRWQAPAAATYSGTATSATSTTLTDTNLALTASGGNPSQLGVRGFTIEIYAGTGAGQYRRITGNTATQVTVDTAWSVTPDATSQYRLWNVLVGTLDDGTHPTPTGHTLMGAVVAANLGLFR